MNPIRLSVIAAVLTGTAAFCFPALGQQPPKRELENTVPKAAPADKAAPAAKDPPPLAKRTPDTPEQRAKLLDDLYAHLATAADERAATEYTQAIMRLWAHSGSPTVDLLVQRGLKLASEKSHDIALNVLNAAVEQAPDHAEAWHARGQVFYLQNDYQRALGDLRRALALDPNHFKALEGLGSILREIGQKKGAFKAFEKLIQVHPFWPGAQQAHDELKREVDGQGT